MASNGEKKQRSLLQSDALYQYILETSVYPRENEFVKELRELTEKHPRYVLSTEGDQIQFMSMLLKLMNAKKTMEIGVFTGHSLLATALALPDNGEILAIDIDHTNYELGLPIIKKAGVAHKIDFREGRAISILDQIIKEGKHHGAFDFIYVDADKENYLNYHERLIGLVKVGGVIGYDNTLWKGTVAAPPDPTLPENTQFCRDVMVEFNKALTLDPRVEICQLSIGDGITLAHRLT